MVIIRISNPNKDVYTYENQSVFDVKRGESSIPVLNEREMPVFLVFGEPNNRQTELIRTTGLVDSALNLILRKPLKYNHTASTNMYSTSYNKVKIYRKIDDIYCSDVNKKTEEETGCINEQGVCLKPTELPVWKEIDIEWDKPETTIYEDPDYEKLVSECKKVEYFYRYTNSENGLVSMENKAYIGDEAGLTTDDNVVTLDELLREIKLHLFSDPNSQKVSDSVLINYLSYSLKDLVIKALPPDNQYFLSIIDITLIPNKDKYLLPSGFLEAFDVRIDGCTIDRIHQSAKKQKCLENNCKQDEKKEETNLVCNYCKQIPTQITNEKSKDPCTICEAKCPEGTYECFTFNEKQDNKVIQFYTITKDFVIISPIPEKEQLLSITYGGIPMGFKKDTKGIFLPEGFREVLVLGAKMRHFQNNVSTEIDTYKYNLMKSEYDTMIVYLEEMFNRRGMARKPNRIKVNNGISAPYIKKNDNYDIYGVTSFNIQRDFRNGNISYY